MKKLIILFMLLANTVYADTIPGWLELDLNTGRYYDFYGKSQSNVGMAEIGIKYGVNLNWFKPYALVKWKTFFNYMENNQKRNMPFRDNYSIGAGFLIKDFFYFEYEHKCSHAVFSETNGKTFEFNNKEYIMFEGSPTASYDMFKIGIKLSID